MTLANGILYERIGPCANQPRLPGTAIGDAHADIPRARISAVVHRLGRKARRHGQRADAGVQAVRQGDRTPVTRAYEEFACYIRDTLGTLVLRSRAQDLELGTWLGDAPVLMLGLFVVVVPPLDAAGVVARHRAGQNR